MEKNKLLCEPSEEEIRKQCRKMEYSAIKLLAMLKECCDLSTTQAALLLGTGRSNLKRHESGEMGMTHKTFCKHLSIYMLYIEDNGIEIPPELEELLSAWIFFMNMHSF